MIESFIHQQYLSDLSICDDLIDFHVNAEDKGPGVIGNIDGMGVVDRAFKDSIDVLVEEPVIRTRYIKLLQEVAESYIKKYPFSNSGSPWTILPGQINLQYYPPGGGYKTYHCERALIEPIVATRHLVFMTYLNDVTDGGGTEFFHQNLIVQARKGLTLIWPTDWTHTHRGIVSPTQSKYIITGWYNFIKATNDTR